MNPEDEKLCRRYTAMKGFRNIISRSPTLTHHQKALLWGQAKAGDLEGAWKGYRKLVKITDEEEETYG